MPVSFSDVGENRYERNKCLGHYLRQYDSCIFKTKILNLKRSRD